MEYDPKHQKISIISKLYNRKYPKSTKISAKVLSVAFKRNPKESGIVFVLRPLILRLFVRGVLTWNLSRCLMPKAGLVLNINSLLIHKQWRNI